MSLTASQKRYLRSFAHELRPVILVGQKGVTEAVLAEFEGALAHHELVKVKLAAEREQRATLIEAMRAHAGADVVQAIGKTACFYRRNPERNQFTLPR
ncbi:MAG: ribosome assembly RNA-binding protein YhbY [Dokdonella sp.]|uniref:ribosome assembly RNA-binding protein YhbY n=1 Tax=Dokdonella sp. TaxID=2291710 RepID=UPI0025C5235D|nr:ribosome assembly RNA-binding protein YhbY [Dokdonella sp.]MBX3700893.1 ribosome assembly RNA-binding protein YhbY [Dokdonella sp.]MCW5579405.1 ribosome assembly RNA-binding protein YhbY [Dokdonella sp.]